ncbi:MAG: hypothetical protein MAG451_02698 [Anaerolineales bacterium]|nr:hypothetical protein [Anaerolineales bacterium]
MGVRGGRPPPTDPHFSAFLYCEGGNLSSHLTA